MTEIAPGLDLVVADCLDALRELAADSVDAVVTDPPYGISFMGNAWDRPTITHQSERRTALHRDAAPGGDFGNAAQSAGIYDVSAKGNRAFQVWTENWAREAYRVLKPGGHLLSFASTRTYHRMAAGVEDAGFEIRDTLAWLFGSGFPKSLDVHKAIVVRCPTGVACSGCRYCETAREQADLWRGYGTALKPAFEPIVVARKPLIGTVAANVMEHGTGALNISGCRIEFVSEADEAESKDKNRHGDFGTQQGGNQVYGDFSMLDDRENYDAPGRWPANVLLDEAWDAVLRLRDTLDDDLWLILSEWCRARNGDVPPVQSPLRRAAVEGVAPEVLLPSMQASMDERKPAGGRPPDARPEALGRVDREDVEEPACEPAVGSESIDVEGRKVQVEGILDGGALGSVGRGQGASPADDLERSRIRGGTSSSDGSDSRAPADEDGSRTPSERREDRQQAREPGHTRGEDAQADPRGDLSRTPRSARPSVEVLMRCVPREWLRFFELTDDEANVGSAALLDEQSGDLAAGNHPALRTGRGDEKVYGSGWSSGTLGERRPTETGGASRFFYCAKVSRAERNAGLDALLPCPVAPCTGCRYCEGKREAVEALDGKNPHPTVKPIALMRWLIRLVTPPGGLVVDPFTGSGSTGCAAALEGMRFLGIEREPEYAAVAEARIRFWAEHGEEALRVVADREASERVREAIAETGQLDLLGSA